LIYTLASQLDRHADADARKTAVAPPFTEYQRQQLQQKYGATEYLRRRWADEPDDAVERINTGMQETLRRFPETRTWTVDDWSWLFFCDTAVVRETAAWRSLDPNTSSLSATEPPPMKPQSVESGPPDDGGGEEMSKDATREFLMKVGTLKGMLNERARGGTPSETQYAALRNELVSIDAIRDALPMFVLTCHTIQEFWLFIKPKFAKYNERSEFLRQEFSPILSWLQGGVAPATPKPTLPPPPKPDIVLVTVNKYETRAVLDAFAAATGAEAVAVPIDDRVYHNLGTLNGTTVYHAISEMGSGGPGGMQQTVDKAIRSLDPGAVIALGIAFGVDEAEQAIGDILLSKQLRLYELQRVGKQSKIILRGGRPDAAPRLVNHFRGFADAKWDGASVTPGVLLTGEKLVDDVDYRKQLQTLESEAIGGEMEGAGLYVSGYDHKVDWIVVKAICDFADGNKGVDKAARQKLAAKNATEFVVQALRYAPLKRR
jgi:nucleoside phosphorylase